MRNPLSNLERDRAPGRRAENYFASSIHPYTDRSGFFRCLVKWSEKFPHHCAFCQLRLSVAGFAPSFARSDRRSRVLSPMKICKTAAVPRRAERFVVPASCCSTCQRYWHHVDEFDMGDEHKSQLIHTLWRFIHAIGEMAFVDPASQSPQLTSAFSESQSFPSEAARLQHALSKVFQEEVIQPPTESD